jgi:hypothetical protein
VLASTYDIDVQGLLYDVRRTRHMHTALASLADVESIQMLTTTEQSVCNGDRQEEL